MHLGSPPTGTSRNGLGPESLHEPGQAGAVVWRCIGRPGLPVFAASLGADFYSGTPAGTRFFVRFDEPSAIPFGPTARSHLGADQNRLS